MPTESGFSSQKKIGEAQFKTVHNLGSDRFGTSVTPKALFELSAIASPLINSEASDDRSFIFIEMTAHDARKGDVLRITSGGLTSWEYDIVEIIDADILKVINSSDSIPDIADEAKIMRWVTSKADKEGNVNFSPGPTQFVKDTVAVQVIEDTLDPSNNQFLPTIAGFYEDGILIPVSDNSIDPAQNKPLPVKLTNITGDINITAGDLNVSTDATNDSMAIGDAITGDTAKIDLNNDTTTFALKVKDDDANTTLADIDTKLGTIELIDFATETTLATLGTEATLADVKIAVESIALADFATEATLASIKTAVELIDNALGVDGNPKPSGVMVIGGVDNVGDTQELRTNAAGELLVNISTSGGGLATETTLAAINTKIANDYGASIGAIRTASQLGNASGQADFNSGADSAQTLRVSANLKRSGNELAYGAGVIDANTLRVVLPSDQTVAVSGPLTDTQLRATAVPVLGPLTDTELRASAVPVSLASIPAAPVLVPSYQEIINLTNTAQTFTAPSGAKWCKVQTDDTNAVNVRVKLGGAATTSSGMQFQPGRSEDFAVAGDISVIAESAVANQKIYIIFGA
jgi:hypothetical protein